jgi:hypothetical protein
MTVPVWMLLGFATWTVNVGALRDPKTWIPLVREATHP